MRRQTRSKTRSEQPRALAEGGPGMEGNTGRHGDDETESRIGNTDERDVGTGDNELGPRPDASSSSTDHQVSAHRAPTNPLTCTTGSGLVSSSVMSNAPTQTGSATTSLPSFNTTFSTFSTTPFQPNAAQFSSVSQAHNITATLGLADGAPRSDRSSTHTAQSLAAESVLTGTIQPTDQHGPTTATTTTTTPAPPLDSIMHSAFTARTRTTAADHFRAEDAITPLTQDPDHRHSFRQEEVMREVRMRLDAADLSPDPTSHRRNNNNNDWPDVSTPTDPGTSGRSIRLVAAREIIRADLITGDPNAPPSFPDDEAAMNELDTDIMPHAYYHPDTPPRPIPSHIPRYYYPYVPPPAPRFMPCRTYPNTIPLPPRTSPLAPMHTNRPLLLSSHAFRMVRSVQTIDSNSQVSQVQQQQVRSINTAGTEASLICDASTRVVTADKEGDGTVPELDLDVNNAQASQARPSNLVSPPPLGVPQVPGEEARASDSDDMEYREFNDRDEYDFYFWRTALRSQVKREDRPHAKHEPPGPDDSPDKTKPR